ncbi:MAG: hypothetical protein NT165_01205 [Candidatus Falkowbacteria bacterium]|nr:hypothetical protein [Candidatus Falkowbacteria bacterium]
MKKIVIFSIIFSFLLASGVAFAANEKNEAAIIFKSGTDLNALLKYDGLKKNVVFQTGWIKRTINPLISSDKNVKVSEKYAINNFVVYGTKDTKKFTKTERADFIVLYKSKYNKLPKTQMDWENLLKLNSNHSHDISGFTQACEDFPDNLSSCTKYECQSPSVEEAFVKYNIVGMVSGKCVYQYRTSTGIGVDCKLSDSSRKVFVKAQEINFFGGGWLSKSEKMSSEGDPELRTVTGESCVAHMQYSNPTETSDYMRKVLVHSVQVVLSRFFAVMKEYPATADKAFAAFVSSGLNRTNPQATILSKQATTSPAQTGSNCSSSTPLIYDSQLNNTSYTLAYCLSTGMATATPTGIK